MEEKLDHLKTIAQKEKKERHIIYASYAVFFSSFCFIFTFNMAVSVFAIMINVCALAAIYSLRAKSDEDSLLENQCTMLIRTFWKTNLFLLIFAALAMFYLLIAVDLLPLKPCLSFLEHHIKRGFSSWNGQTSSVVLDACFQSFLKNNSNTLISGSFIAFSFPLSYLIFRLGRGLKYLSGSRLLPDKKM